MRFNDLIPWEGAWETIDRRRPRGPGAGPWRSESTTSARLVHQSMNLQLAIPLRSGRYVT